MRFRTRSTEIEAEQWFPGKNVPGVTGDNPNRLCGCTLIGGPGNSGGPHVHTHLTGGKFLRPGDWVFATSAAPGIVGTPTFFDALSPEEFEAIYEPIDQPAAGQEGGGSAR